jgi:hypothetical protein
MSRAGKSRQLPIDEKMRIARKATAEIVEKYIERHQKRREVEPVYGTDLRTYHKTMVIDNVREYLKKRRWIKLLPMLEGYVTELLDDFCYGNALKSYREKYTPEEAKEIIVDLERPELDI